MRGSSAASAESWRTTRRPVALPPAWTTRRTEWPPSRPSARRPKRSASKRTPSACRSRTRVGRLAHEDLGRRAPHQPAAGDARCRAGAARSCRRRRARRRGRPAPSSWRSAPAAWPRRAPPWRARARRRAPRTARPRPRPPPRCRPQRCPASRRRPPEPAASCGQRSLRTLFSDCSVRFFRASSCAFPCGEWLAGDLPFAFAQVAFEACGDLAFTAGRLVSWTRAPWPARLSSRRSRRCSRSGRCRPLAPWPPCAPVQPWRRLLTLGPSQPSGPSVRRVAVTTRRRRDGRAVAGAVRASSSCRRARSARRRARRAQHDHDRERDDRALPARRTPPGACARRRRSQAPLLLGVQRRAAQRARVLRRLLAGVGLDRRWHPRSPAVPCAPVAGGCGAAALTSRTRAGEGSRSALVAGSDGLRRARAPPVGVRRR